MIFYNLLPKFGNCSAFAACVLFATGVFANDKVDFVKDIKPILENHCIKCHGPEKEESFRIDVREEAIEYIEDTADDSDLYLVLISDDEDELMPPPDEKTPLTPDQIKLVKTWIDEGADWPEGVKLVDATKPKTAPDDSATQDDPKTEPKPEETKPEETKSAETKLAETKEAETNASETKAAETKAAETKPAETKPAETKAAGNDDPAPAKKPVDPKTQRIYNAIGSLHPAAVHLPIGLLLASGLFALFSLRGNFVMSDCAYYCLWLGTIGAIVACASGWYFSPMEKRGTVEVFADLFDQNHKVFWHRTGALIVTAVALLLALFAAGARNRDPDDGMLWKLGLILLAGGIGWVGHSGGELHYPSDHYKDLNALYQSIVNPDAAPIDNPGSGKPAAPADKKKSGDENSDESSASQSASTKDDNDEVGKASGESIKAIDQEMTK